jgi:hypothetical protein
LTLANLERISETYLTGQYRIDVIDLTKTPQLTAGPDHRRADARASPSRADQEIAR